MENQNNEKEKSEAMDVDSSLDSNSTESDELQRATLLLDLFKAVVLGNLEDLQSFCSNDVDWNKCFKFEWYRQRCVCGTNFECFLGDSPDVFLNEFYDSVKTGRCVHLPDGPTTLEHRLALSEVLEANPLFDVENYIGISEGKLKLKTVGLNPLHIAILLNHRHIVSWLLEEKNVSLNEPTHRLKEPPLNLAVYKQHKEIVMILLNKGANVAHCKASESDDTPAIHAVRNNNAELLELLIQHGADINDMGVFCTNPFSIAVEDNYKDCVEGLLRAGVDTSLNFAQEESMFLHAIRYRPDIARMMINANVDVNQIGTKSTRHAAMTPILVVVAYPGKVDLLKLMMEKGADPNVCLSDDSGHSLLHVAAYSNQPEAIDVLLENKANVHAVSSSKYSALHFAAWDGHLNICQSLIKAGADYDAQTKDRNTPLSLACHGNRWDVIRYLLSECKCNVNNQDKDKDTPLLYTTFNSSLEACQLLLENGADPSLANADGTTPLWNAIYQGNRDIIELLVNLNVPLGGKSRGIQQHSRTDDVVYIYDTPRSPLYLTAERLLLNLPKLLLMAGLDLTQEEWLMNGDLPENLMDPTSDQQHQMLEELRLITHEPLTLKENARRVIRRHTGPGIEGVLKKLQTDRVLPFGLDRYLLMKDA